jgi:hypothetical protein
MHPNSVEVESYDYVHNTLQSPMCPEHVDNMMTQQLIQMMLSQPKFRDEIVRQAPNTLSSSYVAARITTQYDVSPLNELLSNRIQQQA